ncbi:hypothetical protein, partial [Scytonema sp. UIC 10036]|uniref:hypothetical protein n=1 Tax=Scytonema sp. UIC 10036 TaxID=2304196 RepID=UPI001A9A6FE3
VIILSIIFLFSYQLYMNWFIKIRQRENLLDENSIVSVKRKLYPTYRLWRKPYLAYYTAM